MSSAKPTKTNKSLSPGEALFLDRRKRGMTQARYARLHKATVDQVHKWESDVPARNRAGEAIECPDVGITWGALNDAERCVIMRRREGLSRTDLAGRVGVSQQWISAMERGQHPADRLVEFWGLS